MRSVDFGDGRGSVTYASLDELNDAIATLEGEVATEAGTARVRLVRLGFASGT